MATYAHSTGAARAPKSDTPEMSRRALVSGLAVAAAAAPAGASALPVTARAPAATLSPEWAAERSLWKGYEDQVSAIAVRAAKLGMSPNDIHSTAVIGRAYERKRLHFYFGNVGVGDYVIVSEGSVARYRSFV